MKIGVFGAGAIGASLGLRLSAAGHAVTLIGRKSLAQARDQLELTTITGHRVRPAADLVITEDTDALGDVDCCLVTVKSKDTAAGAETLANTLQPDATVVSFQNGLRNAGVLRAGLAQPVAAGMISYNVVRPSPGRFLQATKGPLIAEQLGGASASRLSALVEGFAQTGDVLVLRRDIQDVMAGKLLLNLNNGVCAATGFTIAGSIQDRTLRRCFAILMREGIGAMKANGLSPRSIVGLSPSLIARMLPLPDIVVLSVARKLAAIDPTAKSSTLQDLEAGKTTEIGELCGEVVRLAAAAGMKARANAAVLGIVQRHEQADGQPDFITPAALLAAIQ